MPWDELKPRRFAAFETELVPAIDVCEHAYVRDFGTTPDRRKQPAVP
jgi:hypothetical protein